MINSALYEHIFPVNINLLYKSSGKCDDQQQYKAVPKAAVASTPEGINENFQCLSAHQKMQRSQFHGIL